ncbi:hypothetical protein Glove_183g22 [Diversispora epigaea]|uniref:Uncharacterized protein n=1 Tax=Diversispora epigaea TaxID=1348612 RepID=A0A397IWI5_9GLOM|nr:hypothetical protein Glove_183g22 [Diversispora epigaea]
MISSEQIAELNRIIIEIAALYRQKIQYIVDQTPENQDPLWKLSNLEELRKIREQLKLLFQIRDNCQQVLNDLELSPPLTPQYQRRELSPEGSNFSQTRPATRSNTPHWSKYGISGTYRAPIGYLIGMR